MATIYDVARLAEVSPQTVSNVINGRAAGTMKPETRDVVLEAIRKLDYHPNVNAMHLRRKRAEAIAVVVLDPAAHFLADAFTAEVVSGVADQARARRYQLFLASAQPGGSDDDITGPLHRRQADGLILLPSGAMETWIHTVEAVADTKRPFVVVQSDIDLPSPGLPRASSVRADDYGGGKACGEHLLELGHERIVFLGTRVSWPAVEQRLAGLTDALASVGAAQPSVITADFYSVASGHAASAALFRRGSQRPTALVAANDVLAAGAIAAAREAHISVPEELSVVGFDDLDVAGAVWPPLTTVRVPAFEMGAAAAALLLGAVEDNADPQPQLFATQLVVRASTAAAAR